NGVLIAYVEIPSLFATLAMGIFVYGFGRFELLDQDVMYLPKDIGWLDAIGRGHIAGVPITIILFAAVCGAMSLFLRYTKFGRFIYLMGDNHATARITGIPTRPMMVLQYVLSSLIGFVAGVITAAAVSSMNTRVVNS